MTSPVELVAAVSGRRIRLDRSGRLPRLEEGRDGGGSGGTPLAPPTRIDGQPTLVLHLVAGSAEPAAGSRWLDLADLHELRHPAAVAEAIGAGLAVWRAEVPWPELRPDWYRRGWLVEMDRWIDTELSRKSLVRCGPSVLRKTGSLSAVLQVPLEHGPVFAKASSQCFRHEAAVTALLDRLVPGRVPEVLAADPERGWLLMLGLVEIRDEPPPRLAVAAARVLAEVQVAMVEQLADLRQAGAPDRGLAATLDGLTEVVRDSVELSLLDPGERRTVAQALPWLLDQIQALYATGLPPTLGHGDLHLGNVASAPGSAVLFDWSDAAITFPTLDVALLSRSAGARWAPAVQAAYAEVWRAGYPAAALDRALRLAPLANTAYQAISYEAIYRSQEAGSRWEMGGIVARSLRELVRRWQ